jgi:hypothetical protein
MDSSASRERARTQLDERRNAVILIDTRIEERGFNDREHAAAEMRQA